MQMLSQGQILYLKTPKTPLQLRYHENGFNPNPTTRRLPTGNQTASTLRTAGYALQNESRNSLCSQYNIENDSPDLSNQKAVDALAKELGCQDSDQFQEWIGAHGLNNNEDLIAYAQERHKRKEVINDLLKGCGESLYLRYKDRLDRVLYSLIRVESSEQAHHLFYSIEANELEFGDAAAQYSIGPESKTQGIVGPVDLTTPHPEIAARLRSQTTSAVPTIQS